MLFIYLLNKVLLCLNVLRAVVLVLQLVNLHRLKASIISLLMRLTLRGITCQPKASICQLTAKKNILVNCTYLMHKHVTSRAE